MIDPPLTRLELLGAACTTSTRSTCDMGRINSSMEDSSNSRTGCAV
jgi:hypothetical protein